MRNINLSVYLLKILKRMGDGTNTHTFLHVILTALPEKENS